ncbi:hypothetical protein LC612_30645 [Nostoc sp. CHAB 5834]|nr:hypothetical protein [Nostoc sp. CHAB 5834]
MTLDPSQPIFGINPYVLRGAIRSLGKFFTPEHFSIVLGLPTKDSLPVVKQMLAQGWIAPVRKEELKNTGFLAFPLVYTGLQSWRQFRVATARKRVSLEKAKAVLQRVVDTAREHNRNADGQTMLITRVELFGSVREGRADVGDLDIAVALQGPEYSPSSPDDDLDIDRVLNATLGALRKLKKVSPLVSLHYSDEVKHQLQVPVTVVYDLAEDVDTLFCIDEFLATRFPSYHACVLAEWAQAARAHAIPDRTSQEECAMGATKRTSDEKQFAGNS